MRYLRRAKTYLLCAFMVLVVRIALWVTKYQTVRRWLVRPCHGDDPRAHLAGTVARIVHTVDRVARLIPDASCLTQSIACQALLSRKNIPSTISMGVMKEECGAIKVHAWLIWNGKVVLQGDETSLRNFRKIVDLPTPQNPERT